jgi:predicted permease
MPLLAALLVLCGVRVPQIINNMLLMIGQTTAELGIFTAGLTLAAHRIIVNVEVATASLLKMLVQPLLMIVLVRVLDVHPALGREGILLCALPAGVTSTILASRYAIYESEASSILIVTSLLMALTLPILLLLTSP